jgi:hypothetical protein
VGPKASLEAVMKRKLLDPVGNRTLVIHPVVLITYKTELESLHESGLNQSIGTIKNVGFQVLKAVRVEIAAFWIVIQCNKAGGCHSFRGTYRLYHQIDTSISTYNITKCLKAKYHSISIIK